MEGNSTWKHPSRGYQSNENWNLRIWGKNSFKNNNLCSRFQYGCFSGLHRICHRWHLPRQMRKFPPPHPPPATMKNPRGATRNEFEKSPTESERISKNREGELVTDGGRWLSCIVHFGTVCVRFGIGVKRVRSSGRFRQLKHTDTQKIRLKTGNDVRVENCQNGIECEESFNDSDRS